MQREPLEGAQVDLPTTGDADLPSGQTKRAIARILRQRVGTVPTCPRVGCRRRRHEEVDGIESESSSLRAKRASTSCSSLSPSPAMRPEQGESPASLAFVTVSTRSAYVWLVTIVSWCDSAVLMLWL